jgi:hypothetical protein
MCKETPRPVEQRWVDHRDGTRWGFVAGSKDPNNEGDWFNADGTFMNYCGLYLTGGIRNSDPAEA